MICDLMVCLFCVLVIGVVCYFRFGVLIVCFVWSVCLVLKVVVFGLVCWFCLIWFNVDMFWWLDVVFVWCFVVFRV